MDTKLTLKFEQSVIEKAKSYAKKQGISLSSLIENYLLQLTENKNKKEDEITPLVKSLSGIIKLPKDFDEKNGYGDYLANKYK